MKIVYLFLTVLCTALTSCVNTIANSPGASINNGNSGSAQGRGGWIQGGFQFGMGPSRGQSCSPRRTAVVRPQLFSKTRVKWTRPCGGGCGGPTCGWSNCRRDSRLSNYWQNSGGHRGYNNSPSRNWQSVPRQGDSRPRYGIADTITGRSGGIRAPEYLVRARAQQRR
jgi:hypothetical protein